jgi:hypothetical protein
MTSLSDIDQIRDLKARYCRLADTKQWDEVAALFTEDAVWRIYDVDGSLLDEVPPAEFAATVGGRVGTGQTIHHVFSHEIEFTSNTTAQGVWTMEDRFFQDRTTNPEAPFDSMHGFGHYHDIYRKTEDGWRIAGSDITRLRVEITR